MYLLMIILSSCIKLNYVKNVNKHKDDISNQDIEVAMQSMNPELLRLKIKYIKNLDKKLDSRGTLLHVAANIGNYNILKILLCNGASTLVKNSYGYFPFELTENTKLLNILEEYRVRKELTIAIDNKEIDVIKLLIERLSNNRILFLKVKSKDIIDKLIEDLNWNRDKDIIKIFMKRLDNKDEYACRRLSYLRKRILNIGLKDAYNRIEREELAEYLSMLKQERAINENYEVSNKKASTFSRIAIRNGWQSYFNQFMKIENNTKVATSLALEFIENSSNFMNNFLQYKGNIYRSEEYIKGILKDIKKEYGIELKRYKYEILLQRREALLKSKSTKKIGNIILTEFNKLLNYKMFFEELITKAFTEKDENLLLSLLKKDKEMFFNCEVYNSKVLYVALRNNFLKLINSLIMEGMSIDILDEENRSPLHFAAELGNMILSKYLVEKGAQINIKNKKGESPLYIAYEKNNLDLVNFLIDRGANIKDKFSNGRTLLHYSMEKGDNNLIHRLLELGLDINEKDKDGNVPSTYYIEYISKKININIIKNIEFLIYLVDRSALINLDNLKGGLLLNSILRSPITYDDKFKIIKSLVERKIKLSSKVDIVDDKDNTLLHYSCGMNINFIEFLLKNRIGVNQRNRDGKTFLHNVADTFEKQKDNKYIYNNFNDRKDFMKYINTLFSYALSYDLDYNIKDKIDKTALDYLSCFKFNNIEQIYNQIKLVHKICKQMRFDSSILIKNIIDKCEDINMKEENGNSLLHLLVKIDLSALEYLLEKGARANEKNKEGRIFLHNLIIIFNGNITRSCIKKIIDVAFKYNIDFNIIDKERKTALDYLMNYTFNNIERVYDQIELVHELCEKMNISSKNLVNEILNRCYDINMRDSNGNNLLHLLFRKSDIEQLLKKGIEINGKNNEGHTFLISKLIYFGNNNSKVIKDYIKEILDVTFIYNIDYNFKDNKGKHALDYLVSFNYSSSDKIHNQIELTHELCKRMNINSSYAIKSILNRYSDINIKDDLGNTLLHLSHNVLDIEQLLSRGIEINEKNYEEKTFLHNLISHFINGNVTKNQIVEILKITSNYSLNYNIKDKERKTALEWLISYDLNTIERISDQIKLVHELCKRTNINSSNLINAILDRCSDVNIKNNGTLLHYLFEMPTLVIEYLLIKQVKLNEKDNRGKTFLHILIASFLNNNDNDNKDRILKILERLSKYNVDYNIKDKEGKDALDYLFKFNFDSAEQISNQIELVHKLCKEMNISSSSSIKSILDNCIYINIKDDKGNTLLHLSNNYLTIEQLLKKGAKLNETNNEGKTFIHALIDNFINNKSNIDYVKATLNLEYDNINFNVRDREGKSALDYLVNSNFTTAECISNQIELIYDLCKKMKVDYRSLLDKVLDSIDINIKDINGNGLLHLSNNFLNLERMIRRGIRVNDTNNEGKTFLHNLMSFFYNNNNSRNQVYIEKFIDIAYKYNLDFNIRNIEGKTALNEAINFRFTTAEQISNQIELIYSLCEKMEIDSDSLVSNILDNYSNINIKDHNNNTLLHLANNCSNIEQLLRKNIRANEKNNEGKTFIHTLMDSFCNNNNSYNKNYVIKVINITSKYNVDYNIKDKDGKTALNYLVNFNFITVDQVSNQIKIVKELCKKIKISSNSLVKSILDKHITNIKIKI